MFTDFPTLLFNQISLAWNGTFRHSLKCVSVLKLPLKYILFIVDQGAFIRQALFIV